MNSDHRAAFPGLDYYDEAVKPYTVIVVDMPTTGNDDTLPAHLLAKINDRVPASRLIRWDGHDTMAVLMPDTPPLEASQITDMVCVEIAAHHMPNEQMITTYTYPPFSAPPGV